MRVLVLGAGGTGGYFGARCIEAGHDVVFLVRPARAQNLRDHGLRVVSANGDFAAPVAVVTEASAAGAVDLVLLACKAYDLDAAIASVAPAVGPHTRVLPLLNGLRHLDVLDGAFGVQRVWGGLCHISVTLADDGAIRHLGTLHRLTFGARAPDPRFDALAAALMRVPVEVRASADVLGALWEKFTFLATLAGMTCLMRAAIGQIVAAPHGERLLRRAYAEAIGVAAAGGRPIAAAAQEEALRILTTPASPLKASMLRDLERGGRTEGAHILGDLLARGSAAGLDLPLLAAAAIHVALNEGLGLRA